MPRRTRPMVMITMATVLALGLVGPARGAVGARFKGSGTSWSPTRARISAGEVVKWKAVSGTHTVTSYGGGWSKDVTLSPGDTTRKRFKRTGTFAFYCQIHGNVTGGVCTGMCGKVIVR